MRFTKNITTRIKINNPISFYANSGNETIEQKMITFLENNFLGICYASSYINKILDVCILSKPMIQNIGDGSASVDLVFTADVIVYNPGEMIKAKILANDGKVQIIAISENLHIFIPSNQANKNVKRGQEVVCSIVSANYPIKCKNMSAIAVIVFNLPQCECEFIINKKDHYELKGLRKFNFDPKISKHLQASKSIDNSHTMDIKEFVEKMNGFKYPIKVSRPAGIDLEKPIIKILENQGTTGVQIPLDRIMDSLIFNYECCGAALELYTEISKEDYKKNENIWAVSEISKKD